MSPSILSAGAGCSLSDYTPHKPITRTKIIADRKLVHLSLENCRADSVDEEEDSDGGLFNEEIVPQAYGGGRISRRGGGQEEELDPKVCCSVPFSHLLCLLLSLSYQGCLVVTVIPLPYRPRRSLLPRSTSQ